MADQGADQRVAAAEDQARDGQQQQGEVATASAVSADQRGRGRQRQTDQPGGEHPADQPYVAAVDQQGLRGRSGPGDRDRG